MSERTTASLREILFAQIEGVRDGKIDAHKASAVAKLAMTLLKSLEVEMQYLILHEQLDRPEEAHVGTLKLAAPEKVLKVIEDPLLPTRTVRGRAY